MLALHVTAVIGLQPDRAEGEGSGDPAIVIELEAVSAAPVQARSELTPGPEQTQIDQISQASVAQQEVLERTEKEKEANTPKVDVATAPEPEVVMPEARETPETKLDEKTKEKETEKQQQTPSQAHLESLLTSAPEAESVIAPQVTKNTGAPVEDAAALVTWRARLAAHVQRFKRYPAEALEKHLHGTALVRFTIDRIGAVISAEIVSRSGIEVLDRESLSLIARAAPLPAAPTHVVGTHFTFTVPVHFHRQH